MALQMLDKDEVNLHQDWVRTIGCWIGKDCPWCAKYNKLIKRRLQKKNQMDKNTLIKEIVVCVCWTICICMFIIFVAPYCGAGH